MDNHQSTTALAVRLATPEDITLIETLDSFSASPTRDIHRDMEKYFGSVDPSTHEHTFIFIAEIAGVTAGKAELMLAPPEDIQAVGYVKRVIVHPDFRGRGLAKHLMQYIINFAHSTYQLKAIDLHVWEKNYPAIHLYEELGFELQHRELYYRLPLQKNDL
jgi:ribosomal protein S18 acetylase RimI-like enzyme